MLLHKPPSCGLAGGVPCRCEPPQGTHHDGTHLWHVCQRGATEAVTRLLELRADVNLSDSDLGQTAIVYLTIFFSGNMRGLEVADVLLRARADVNKISKIAPAVQVVEYGARALKLFKKARF